MTDREIKDALDRCQHAQNLQADETKRITARVNELVTKMNSFRDEAMSILAEMAEANKPKGQDDNRG
jgi:hypothetical protein